MYIYATAAVAPGALNRFKNVFYLGTFPGTRKTADPHNKKKTAAAPASALRPNQRFGGRHGGRCARCTPT